MSKVQYIFSISEESKWTTQTFDCSVCKEHYDRLRSYICSVCERPVCMNCMWICDECTYDSTYCTECTCDHYP